MKANRETDMVTKITESLSRLRLFALLLSFCIVSLTYGQEVPDKEDGPSESSPVRITSDRVDSDQDGRWVNFTGNVKATQDDGTIWADSLKVYYQPADEKSGAAGTIKKMVAEGNVKIVFDEDAKTATAQKAVYTADDKVLVLTGGSPRVQSGENFVQGKRITLFQKEGRTVVEGGEEDRVEATFYTQEEGGLIE